VKTELPLFEFPVTIEDEFLPPLGDRLPQAVALAGKIARNGGLCVVLIHPDVLGHKLAFEGEFIEAVRGYSWFGTIGEYGTWWSARNEVQIDAEWQGDRFIGRLFAPKPVNGITLEVPSGLTLDPRHRQPIGAEMIAAEMTADRVVLGQLQGMSVLHLVRQ
jgi:hypothetical protein